MDPLDKNKGKPGEQGDAFKGGAGGMGGTGGKGEIGGTGGAGGDFNEGTNTAESIVKLLKEHAEASARATPKTIQLYQDMNDPVTRMKGCGTIVILIAGAVVLTVSTFVQWNLAQTESIQRQEIYDQIQVLHAEQEAFQTRCDEILFQLDSVAETVESVETTVESVESTVEDTRTIEIPLPLPVIDPPE